MKKHKSIPCLIALAAGALALMFILWIHPFLAISKPVKANILIIESWISDSTLKETALCYIQNHPHILIVGNNDRQRLKSSSSFSLRDCLLTMGVADSSIHNLVVRPTGRKRTLSFATAVKQWFLLEDSPHCIGCNVVSEGVHARKSLIVYKRALSGIAPVGVIAIRPSEYNPDYWWFSSIGWAWVVLDTIKTIRAIFLGY